jgi:hypothetical protein
MTYAGNWCGEFKTDRKLGTVSKSDEYVAPDARDDDTQAA